MIINMTGGGVDNDAYAIFEAPLNFSLGYVGTGSSYIGNIGTTNVNTSQTISTGYLSTTTSNVEDTTKLITGNNFGGGFNYKRLKQSTSSSSQTGYLTTFNFYSLFYEQVRDIVNSWSFKFHNARVRLFYGLKAYNAVFLSDRENVNTSNNYQSCYGTYDYNLDNFMNGGFEITIDEEGFVSIQNIQNNYITNSNSNYYIKGMQFHQYTFPIIETKYNGVYTPYLFKRRFNVKTSSGTAYDCTVFSGNYSKNVGNISTGGSLVSPAAYSILGHEPIYVKYKTTSSGSTYITKELTSSWEYEDGSDAVFIFDR